jgi:translation initiation factor IF-2
MKLIELAKEYNLETDLLREVVEQDLSIPLPKGMESDLKEKEVARILACDGLETKDGKPFTPIIAKEFEEKHKRSVAARKAAETRKKKLSEEEEKKKRDDEVRIAAERKKHSEEIARRDAERLHREAIEADAAAKRAEVAELAKLEIESARAAAEEEMRKRETEARRLASEFAAIRGDAAASAAGGAPATLVPAAANDAPADVQAPIEARTPTTGGEAKAPVEATPVAPAQPEKAAQPAKAAASKPPEIKGLSGMGSKLASLAKATHDKSDHSIKAVPKPPPAAPGAAVAKVNDESLSPEDRRRLIQENIRKNLAMAAKVRDTKTAERARRKPGFAPIDRSKTPGGPGAGRGPGRPGGPPRPGGPGAQRGPKRDNRDHRADRPDEVDEHGNKILNRRRILSTDDMDLSGKTEFDVSLPCTVREFSEASGIKSSTVIAKLFMAGVMGNINSTLDKDTVELLAQEFKKTVHIVEAKTIEDEVAEATVFDDKPEDLAPRPPIVTIMGHVDHGKTSLLDAIKKTQVAAGEAGGITQHIGAYTVTAPSGLEVTFIDTPGHEAFTEMRARGAQVTDVAVIVVAADDGVMPQTIEAINHAKAAGVTIVVAMNKIDKETAQPEKVIRQLSEQGLQAEEWGGEIAVIKCSAVSGVGIDELLERLSLETDILELKSNHFASASGTVLEANRSEGQGVTATVIVQRGSLALGDIVLAGNSYGRVRAMTNWKGEKAELAGPSHAVEILGLSELPRAGERFTVVEDLKQAAEAAEVRGQALRERELTARSKVTTAASIFGDLAQQKKKEVKLVLKVDASGSLEVLSKAIPSLSTDEVRVTIIHSAVGAVNSNDVTLAEASKALLFGFHVIADSKARAHADRTGVEIRTYTIIYEMLDDLKKAMSGLLDPEVIERVSGHAEVRATFNTSKVGMVAGLYITDGKVTRDAGMRITRDHVIIHTGTVGSLRRFKEDVREVKEGFECGLTIEGFQDIKTGDVMEFFVSEKKARTL